MGRHLSGLFVTNNALGTIPSWTAVPYFTGKNVYDLKIRPNDPNANRLYLTWRTGQQHSSYVNWRYMYSNDNGINWQNVPGQPASTSGAFELTIESVGKTDNLTV